jgi:diadenylate cyclase
MFNYLQEWAGIPPLNFPDWNSIGLIDIIDIVIVAMLIYFILGWIRKSRAWSLLKGIFFFAVIAALAYLFRMVTVTWVVQNAFAMGLVAVVILFQSELRKGLEQLGKGVLLTGFTQNTDARKNTRITIQTINEIVRAAKDMSKARTGAIICIERNVPLGEHEATGIQIDAVVSSQLIMNIFEDKTPLHDGAILIRANRVVAATCIFPLTSEDIGRELGTRHRAAVGITEVSDAFVVVVSEETGAVSAADGGKLQRHLTENQLRDLLIAAVAEDRRRLILWKKTKGSSPV